MQFVKERLAKWIQAAIILVIGICCIVAGAKLGTNDPAAAGDALDVISTVIGITFVVVGGLAVLLAIVVAILAKKGFAAVAIPGGLVLAIGISLLVFPYAADFIVILLHIIPFILIVLGAIIFLDAVFTLVMAIKAKAVKGALPGIILCMVVGAVAVVLGALCLADVITFGAQLIVFGIIVCLVGVLQLVLTFVKLPDTVIAVVKAKEEE